MEQFSMVSPDVLIPWHKNPRKNDRAIPKVVESIRRYGFTAPIVARPSDRRVLAGHTRLAAALRLKLPEVPVRWIELDDAQAAEVTLADNRLGELASWDDEALGQVLADIGEDVRTFLDFDVEVPTFDVEAEATKRGPRGPQKKTVHVESEQVPVGSLWQLGPHRVLCGDATDSAALGLLFEGRAAVAQVLHADPPYGMNKSASVANDDLHGRALDEFQARWWEACRPHLVENASAYVWGNPLDLWRWWFDYLANGEPKSLRNEIVWDKENGFGMSSAEMRGYAISTERCLFFMLGTEFVRENANLFFEPLEPLRHYLASEAERMGWTPKDVNRIVGVGMYGHWFTRSQWSLIPRYAYERLRNAAGGAAFLRSYEDIEAEYQRSGYLARRFRRHRDRAYFDNTHDNMAEVWRFPRVHGAERFGHETPKPVAMIERTIVSSTWRGAVVLEPFLGTGTTLMAAENTDRVCYGLELLPQHVETILKRWSDATGKTPKRVK